MVEDALKRDVHNSVPFDNTDLIEFLFSGELFFCARNKKEKLSYEIFLQ